MKTKFFTLGFVACLAIACLAVPTGAYASDAWDGVSAGDQYDGDLVAFLVAPGEINDLALLPSAITSGLRSSLTVPKHEHGPSCTPAMAANPSAMIGGVAPAFSKPGSITRI